MIIALFLFIVVLLVGLAINLDNRCGTALDRIARLEQQLSDECQRHEDCIRQCQRLEKELAELRERT